MLYNQKHGDFSGYTLHFERMKKLKALQDTFVRCGKTLICVHAPCKAWYFPEHIPPILKNPQGENNNYKTLVRIGDSLGINQIDFNAWFLAMKDTSKEMLYSKQGLHWTNYGAMLAADSLVNYIERLRHIRMRHPRWRNVIHTTEPRIPDNDLADNLNLIFPFSIDTLCYPELEYATDSQLTMPKCIYIGDSYVVNWIRTDIIHNINAADWQFWFSFKHIFTDSNHMDARPYPQISDYDWKNAINNTDCIIIVHTPKNAQNFGSGFIEQAYDHYFPGK